MLVAMKTAKTAILTKCVSTDSERPHRCCHLYRITMAHAWYALYSTIYIFIYSSNTQSNFSPRQPIDTPKIVFPRGISAPHNTQFLSHTTLHLKQHLDRFIGFSTAYGCDQQANQYIYKPTDHAKATAVATGCLNADRERTSLCQKVGDRVFLSSGCFAQERGLLQNTWNITNKIVQHHEKCK